MSVAGYSGKTTVEWVGLDLLRFFIHQLPAELSAQAIGITQTAADNALREIRAAYPIGPTGNLVRGLRLTSGKAPRYGQARVLRSTAPHGYIFEAGTKPRRNRRGAGRGFMPAADIFVPVAMRHRARMYGELRAIVAAAGFDVSGIGTLGELGERRHVA